ncbi:MAG: V-type ATP synthase subunit I, partial [Gallicola sp.]|nr:V-type ATP synthase subunit I [Gallicola sp.]
MAIVDMSKFHLMSFGYDRDLLLRDLQRFDYVHFDDLQVEDDEAYAALNEVEVPESITEINEELAKANWAIDILSPYKVKLGMITEMKLGQKS